VPIFLHLFTIKKSSSSSFVGWFFKFEHNEISSLKEQSLMGEVKAYSHLKTLRIAPGNWRMVEVA
jgi:hypothetical protein